MLKLSFSIKGWEDYSFQDLKNLALENNFLAIDLKPDTNASYMSKNGEFDKYNSAATMRSLKDEGLTVACVCYEFNIGNNNVDVNAEALKSYIDFASSISVPYISVCAGNDENCTKENVVSCIREVLPYAVEKDVTILLETKGIFADSSNLSDIIREFSCDNIGALWDMYETYFINNEDPEKTITNLGAYIKHVHIKDYSDGEYCLIGEGEIPTDIMINALSSINYRGYIALDWNKEWMSDLDELDVIFAHFSQYMEKYQDVTRKKSHLYYNNAHTGKYLSLIHI